jgi:hypothetical protein
MSENRVYVGRWVVGWGGGEKPFTREINSFNSEVPLFASRNSVLVLLM